MKGPKQSTIIADAELDERAEAITVKKCPHCGDQHGHNGTRADDGTHRISCNDQGYYLNIIN